MTLSIDNTFSYLCVYYTDRRPVEVFFNPIRNADARAAGYIARSIPAGHHRNRWARQSGDGRDRHIGDLRRG